MSGDYSRLTFDPRKRFAGVLMQQGRVQLDSDWNEETDLLRERVRLLGLDSGGTAWVAYLTTPDAFLIGALAGPPADLSIGEGRIYVDGRLAELFAGEGATYLNQPFLPEPPALNPAVDTIVYLDLWEREVCWTEDPRLLDVALGGVDTTTRVQQVWQVKLAEQPGVPAACGIDLDALFPPSAGRLTTSAVAPPAPDDPCILPPAAGYRGIENRLYRVEVQVGGALGTARFKWSRDNGSIVSRASAIAVAGGQSRISVNRLGRDEVLRFRIGDWVSLTDDHRELNGEAGQMARVIDLDEAQRVVILDRAVPTAGRAFGATAADIAARNTRLQRWDEQAPGNALDADGLMTTAAGPIDLEDGVQVSFSVAAAGGAFRVGDYWVFAARTADASVEPLNQAPPRGIAHQYLQLAAIPAGGAPTDCRPPAPTDEGCCTFVVKPGGDIQAAIDALPAAGGCVCLKAGLHAIDAPLVLQKDNVTLHGESLGAIVVNKRGGGLLVVSQAMHGRVHDIVFRQVEGAADPAIQVDGAVDLAFSDCRIETAPRADAIGLFAVASLEVVVTGCTFLTPAVGIWFDRGCSDVVVAKCVLEMAEIGPNLPSNVAIVAREMRGLVTVEDNIVLGAVYGVIVNDAIGKPPVSRARYARVSANRIELVVNPAGQPIAFGIDVAAPDAIVADNHVLHRNGLLAAIRLCGSGSRATGNVIVARGDAIGATVAILAGDETGGKLLPLERIAIGGNIIEGPQHGIVVAGVANAEATGNILGRGAGKFGIGIALSHATDCIVADNQLIRAVFGIFAMAGARNAILRNRIEGGSLGVAVALEEAPSVAECRLTDLDFAGIVAIVTTQRTSIVENRVVRCGGASAVAVGVGALAVFGELYVEANEVMDTGVLAGPGGAKAAVAFGLFGAYILEAHVAGNLITYSSATARSPAAEDRALLMMGLLDYEMQLGGRSLTVGFPIQIADNKFVGTGATALVELREIALQKSIFVRFERVLASGNYCAHIIGDPKDGIATVQLRGRALSASGNQVKATTPNVASWHLHGMPGPFVGNVSNGPTLGRAAASQFPAPENAFNIIM